MAALRSNFGWFVAVYWLFVGAAEIQADYDALSCARESRSFQSKPDVPCDLVKNTFCDTSGENYPWTKLRKFVFENQGLIKRMYGYQTHYTILKDEILELLDDDTSYDPVEMYSPEAQVVPPEHTRRVRNSVRSNAFREEYNDRNAASDDREFPGEWQDEGQIYFDDQGEKIPRELSSSNRRHNARHIDDGSSGRRGVKMLNFQHSGKRSIDASSNVKQIEQQLDEDKSSKLKPSNNFGPIRAVQIKQGYSQSTVEGAPTLTPEKLRTYSTERRSGEHDGTSDTRPSAESTTSGATTPAEDHDGAALKFPDAQDSSKSGSSLTGNGKSEKDAVAQEDMKKMDILFAELLNQAEIITAESSTASNSFSEADFADDADYGATESSINATAPRPPNSGVEEDYSTTSVLTESLVTQQDEDYVTTEAGLSENSWLSVETQEAGVSREGIYNETFTLNPEDRSSSSDEFDTFTEVDTQNIDRSSVQLGTEGVSPPIDTDNFKFPDEIPTNRESPATDKGAQSRRTSNTRRPASAESRQPSKQHPGNKWSGYEHSIDASPTISIPARVHAQLHGGGGGKKTSKRQPSDGQQAMWRRPQEDEPITPSGHPAPPTPSTVPTPLPNAPLKKGVNACPVETDVVAPYWANNTRGEVLALLNLAPFEQYVHWEKCRYEYRQMYCRQGCRCEQQYRLHRMLAFDPSNDCRGIFSDWFRFPSGCICKCYDLPEQATRIPALYSRRPRGRSDPETDEALGYSSGHGQGRATKEGDLSDVYFESEDALLPLDQAQDRMDDGYQGDDETLLDGAASTIYESREHVNQINNKHFESEAAVLHGDPVSSLYSRAEASKNKPKVQLQSIPPQRRPRPHVIGQRRQPTLQLPNQDQGYNLRFSPSARSLRYSPVPSSINHYNFQPSQQFLNRRRYYQNRRFRARNGWNPQASFPSNLSNPRFLKYVDGRDSRKFSAGSRLDDARTDQGSNNLNLNHLMQPAPSSRILPSSLIASSQLPNSETFDSGGVQTPQYFFNLTSHLIRTEQLDSRRPLGSGFKTRESRNFFSDDEA